MATLSGIPVDPITGEPKDERGLLALQKQEEEEQEETGFDPMRMAALQAGASLLRSSGPRYLPMSFGQAIGHAIPAGIQGYYQQDALNQQEQQAMLERQQAEQEALQEKQQAEAEASQKQALRINFEAALKNMGISHKDQTWFLSIYDADPKEAHKLLEERMTKEEKKEKGPKNKYQLVTEEEKKTLGLPPDVYQKVTPQDGDVPFYIDKMGTKLEMPVEEKKADKPSIGFVDDPKSANLIVTENGAYKTSVPRLKEGEEATPEMVQGVYNGLVDLDPANEPTYNALREQIEYGSSYKEIYDALMEKLKAFEKGEVPEVIDYEGVSQNIYDKLIAGKDAQGRPLVTALKLEGIMELPAEEKFNKLKNVLDSIDTMSYRKFVSEGGLEVRQASLQQTKDEYDNEQKKYIKREQHRLADQARKMNWGEARLMMEEQKHDRTIRLMDKNWEDAQIGNLVPADKWIEEFGGELPSEVAFVERRKDGTRGKLIKKDWTNYIEPLNDDAKVAISEEVDSLFTKYGDKFSDIDRTEIKQLLYSKDPMDALKKAHAYLQEQKVPGIAPPAMILKKYQSDAAVKRHIGEALSMLNDYTKPEDSDKSISEIIKDAAGFFKGRLTEKAKHPLYQKFMAIATAGTLTKRHDLIGSQMTEGELRFTEPMFVSPHDTPASLRVKLETLLADATFNMDLTQRMFSEEAGYNASLWTEGGFNSAADMGK